MNKTVNFNEYKNKKIAEESPEQADIEFDQVNMEAAFRAALHIKQPGVDERFSSQYNQKALEDARRYFKTHPLPDEKDVKKYF